MKIYRSYFFNDERKWRRQNKLDDVRQVGVKKAIGYVYLDKRYKNIFKEFADKLSLVVWENRYRILWVGDLNMIQNILDQHKDIINSSGWSIDAKEFFGRLTRENVNHNNNAELYHVVCELFNSWCLFCEEPVWITADGTRLKEPLSSHPCNI